jgi:hypothetical protein
MQIGGNSFVSAGTAVNLKFLLRVEGLSHEREIKKIPL